MAVHDDSGEWLVLTQHPLERGIHVLHLGSIATALRVYGRVACCEQKRVALAKGDIERLREIEQHGPAGDASPAFNEADVTLGDSGIHRQIELTLPSQIAPSPQQCAHVARRCSGLAVRLAHEDTSSDGRWYSE